MKIVKKGRFLIVLVFLILIFGAFIGSFNRTEEEITSQLRLEPCEGSLTVLYDNYVYEAGTQAEWGYSCLIETPDMTILFDTGGEEELLQFNIEALDIDVSGNGAKWVQSSVVRSRESGSTLRFMIPIAMVSEGERTFEGEGRLVERPITPYINMFDEAGIQYDYNGTLPLKVNGALKSGTFTIPGNISSQFITGLLMALPVIEGDSEIVIEGELESASYVELTLDVLEAFGIAIDKTESGFKIKGGQSYTGCTYEVEGDFSQAAFFIAAGLLGEEPLTLRGLSKTSKQGDRAMIDIVKSMGGVIDWRGDDLNLSVLFCSCRRKHFHFLGN